MLLRRIIGRWALLHTKCMDLFTSWLNRRYHFGALRFRLTRLAYRLNPFFPEGRNLRWDFILKYLPPLKMIYYDGIKVLDIGCVDSLLLYELRARRYHTYGMDLRDYTCKLPKDIQLIKHNILEPLTQKLIDFKFHYIICTSVIELLGTAKYGEALVEKDADRIALENIHKILYDDGYFIMSVPIFHWRFIRGRGYTLGNILKLINGIFHIFEITQCGGHICVVLVKLLDTGEGRKDLLAYTWGEECKKD